MQCMLSHQAKAKIGSVLLAMTIPLLIAGIIFSDIRISLCASACGIVANILFFFAIGEQGKEIRRVFGEKSQERKERSI